MDEERAIRDRVRAFREEAVPIINPLEARRIPFELIPAGFELNLRWYRRQSTAVLVCRAWHRHYVA